MLPIWGFLLLWKTGVSGIVQHNAVYIAFYMLYIAFLTGPGYTTVPLHRAWNYGGFPQNIQLLEQTIFQSSNFVAVIK